MSSLTFHKVAIVPLIYGLKNARAFITKGYEHAQAQNIDPDDYLTARIYHDMGDFRYQVYRFTEAAKASLECLNPRLEGITLPDEERTFPELLARIDKTIKYMESFKENDFDGQEDQEVVLKFQNGTVKTTGSGLDYITQFGHGNFWFHVTTAYNLLRMKGVDVGKFDFLNGAKLIEMVIIPKEE